MFQIPKMKILVYVLTFLGYAYSGYGSGTLNNLRDAVLAAETVFQDVLGNVVTIARKFRDIHSVFDAAVDENCSFKCDTGNIVTKNFPLICSVNILMDSVFKKNFINFKIQ